MSSSLFAKSETKKISLQICSLEKEEKTLIAETSIFVPSDAFFPAELVYFIPCFRPLKGEGCVYLAVKSQGEEIMIGWSKNISKTQAQLQDIAQSSIKYVFPGTPEEATSIYQKYAGRAREGKWLMVLPEERKEIFSLFLRNLARVAHRETGSERLSPDPAVLKLCEVMAEEKIKLDKQLEEIKSLNISLQKQLAEASSKVETLTSQLREKTAREEKREIPDYLECYTIYQLMKLMEEKGHYPPSGYNKSYYISALQDIKRKKTNVIL